MDCVSNGWLYVVGVTVWKRFSCSKKNLQALRVCLGHCTACRMGQTRSDLSHTTAASGRAKWKAVETTQRLRSGEKRRSDQLNRKPMKNNVLSCLGRRKRDSSQTEADLGSGNGAGDPAACRDHRVGKLPRDEAVSAVGEHRASPGRFETPSGLDESTEAAQLAVNRGATAGPSDAPGLERRTGEVSGAGYEEPKPAREDNASDPPTKAMEEQPLGGNSQDRVVSEVRELTGTSQSSAPLLTSDPNAERTLTNSPPDQPLDCGLSVTDAEAKMTKTDCSTVSRPPKAAGDQNKCCPVKPEDRKDSDQALHGPQGGQSYPGTIPKLIITRDPSPTRSQGAPGPLSARTEPSTGSCLDPHPDDESPSDSGCGGSPALMRSPRKLSNSSSIGLSSASSFEESEDDFTGSDIESSLSPARSLCSPDDGTGVSVFFMCFFPNDWLKLSVQFTNYEHLHEEFIFRNCRVCWVQKSWTGLTALASKKLQMQTLRNWPYIMADIQYVVKGHSSIEQTKLLHSCTRSGLRKTVGCVCGC